MMNLSRRELAGAAGATVALAFASVPSLAAAAAPVDRAEWARRLARYQRSVLALERYDHCDYAAAKRRFDAKCAGLPEGRPSRNDPEQMRIFNEALAEFQPAEARFEVLAGRSWEAMRDVLATPAPTVSDVLTKLEIWADEARGDAMESRDLGHILADLKRLV